MGKVLSDDQVARYRRDGFLSPVPLLNGPEARELRRRFETLEAHIGEEAQVRYKIKAHLPFPWLCNLIRHPKLLDAVEDMIGPNILCWGSSFFSKNAHDPRYVSWHQDTTYYGLKPRDTLTAWVAFTEVNVENGCMKMLPGTHREGVQVIHEETFDPNNLLSRGQTIRGIDESKAVDVVLRAGEFSFHSELTFHASPPNRSDDRRIGYSIHYIAPHVRQTLFDGATAMICRGRDTHGYWQIEPTPTRDFDPECLAALDTAYAQYKVASQKATAA
jgi:hypothetical protein